MTARVFGVLFVMGFAASGAGAQTAGGPVVTSAAGPGIVRQLAQAPGADLLVAARIPPGFDLLFLSGKVAAVVDPAARTATYGDMRRQTTSILTKIAATLGHHGMGVGDIVKMTVYLVGDPANGNKVDRAGFTAAYSQFFGTPAQPNLPARTMVQVVALDNPAYLVAVDVTASARPTTGR